MDGTTLVGWILATVGFAGIYGAFKNETWLSVMMSAVRSQNPTRPIDVTSYGTGSGGPASKHAPDKSTPGANSGNLNPDVVDGGQPVPHGA